MGIFGNPAGSFIQGRELAMDRKTKQENMKMQKQTMQMQQRKSDNANYEQDLIKNYVDEELTSVKGQLRTQQKQSMTMAWDAYTTSIDTNTAFTDDNVFSADLTALNNAAAAIPAFAKGGKLTAPNTQDEAQLKQMENIYRDKMGDNYNLKPEDLKKLMTSGGYIVSGNGVLLDAQQVMAMTAGSEISISGKAKWSAYNKAINQLALSKKGEFGGSGSETDAGLQLYSQIEADKKMAQDILDSGATVPDALKARISHNENLYNKEYVSAAQAAKKNSNREEYDQAVKREESGDTYKGYAKDVQYFNKLQLKDKEKKFEAVQKTVDSFRTFKRTKDRLGEILGQADIDRDAVSNVGFKIKQLFGDETQKTIDSISGKSWEEINKDKNAMAAFDRIETAIGFPMVMLIKEISGAAVTNEEREYLMNLVIGGEFKNMNSLTEKLDEFVNTLGERTQRALDKKITGGKAIRPNWAKTVEAEINSSMTTGKVGSTLNKTDPVFSDKQKKLIAKAPKGTTVRKDGREGVTDGKGGVTWN